MSGNGVGADGRWLGVGSAAGPDAAIAAFRAASGALNGEDARLLLVFASVVYDPAQVAEGLAMAAPGVPVIGCSSRGEISPSGSRGGSIVAIALGGPGFSVTTAVAEGVAGRQRVAGAEVATAAEDRSGLPNKVMLLLTDSLVREQESILRGCYGVLGAGVPMVGGAAAEQRDTSRGLVASTFLFHDGKVHTDAVVAATIASAGPLSVSVKHGWRKFGDPMIVTSTGDGRVYTLDDRPAMDVYLDRLGAPPEAYVDAAEFTRFALPRPLGVQRRSGVQPRNLATGFDLAGRTISGGSAIDHGCLTWAMCGDEQSILAAADEACAEAIDGLGGTEPLGLLTFSCSALLPVLGQDGTRRENETFAGRCAGKPFGGFHTSGEIARVRGIDGFHNQTLAVLALG
ncbi:FIST signal transduction protein [Crossiella sp. CA198]|uniref:FIST signal transduction protein n=1 Tax=Crossiella sp. CA198 TaxID=3455607 RepID=UPI003F8D84B0